MSPNRKPVCHRSSTPLATRLSPQNCQQPLIVATPTRPLLRTDPNNTSWAEDGALKAAWQYIIRGTDSENGAASSKPEIEWEAASTLTDNPDERKIIAGSGASLSKMELSRLWSRLMGRSSQPRRPESTCKIWTCSSRSNSSKTLQRCYLWETFRIFI